MIKTHKGLLHKWRQQSKRLSNKSDKTWRQLGCGKLEQIDSTIYSVYEDRAQSNQLNECIIQLEKLIKELES